MLKLRKTSQAKRLPHNLNKFSNTKAITTSYEPNLITANKLTGALLFQHRARSSSPTHLLVHVDIRWQKQQTKAVKKVLAELNIVRTNEHPSPSSVITHYVYVIDIFEAVAKLGLSICQLAAD